VTAAALRDAERPATAAAPAPPIVSARHLHKRFGRRTVLGGVSCDLGRGRVTAILGPNAAGKTTFIKILLGLVRADAGEVLVDGQPIGEEPGYRRSLGYMPQAARFPENLSGRRVLEMLRDLRGSAPTDERLIDDFRLADELDKPVRTLSGGTRQKLNAVLAFLFRPSLLVLDEPTAGLDPIASGELKCRILERRAAGVSVILTSHVLGEIEELADDLVFLLEGRVAFQGPLGQLRSTTGEERLERALARLMTGGLA
jgi:Cu-processing system ATP-binding protein